MIAKIIINTERCKGCGMCVEVCPKGDIVISGESNKNGYFPARPLNADCTGCSMCAIICAETCIEVERDGDSRIVAAKSKNEGSTPLKGNVGRSKVESTLVREKS